jgi:class 3 adenylate cyclase
MVSTLTSGTVTCLFTDIEGSTRLREERPRDGLGLLLQHDDPLRACIESHRGRVLKTVRDAFRAVFANPRNAVGTLLASQQCLPALALQTPRGQRPLEVRMVLRTGVGEERDTDS